MRCGMNEILDVELGGGLFWLALLVCGSWLAGMWGVGLLMFLAKDPDKMRKLESGGVQ